MLIVRSRPFTVLTEEDPCFGRQVFCVLLVFFLNGRGRKDICVFCVCVLGEERGGGGGRRERGLG